VKNNENRLTADNKTSHFWTTV